MIKKPSTILEQLLFTTVKITAVPKGRGSPTMGTGFMFGYNINERDTAPFIVTNKHVVQGAKEIVVDFTKKVGDSPLVGETVDTVIRDSGDLWYPHPNEEIDIAVAAMGPLQRQMQAQGLDIFYIPIPPDIIPTEKQIAEEIDAVEDVIFLGYPIDIYDKKHNLPVVRKGITATPVSIDFEGTPAFLVDGSIFPGSSGSPVFIYNVGGYSTKKAAMVIGNRILFVGILSSGFQMPGKTKQMVDIGIVFKSQVIKQLIGDILKEKRLIP